MMRLIPEAVLSRMLKDRSSFASRFRYAVAASEECIRAGRANERYDALGMHAIWFAEAETPLDWLDLLWQSSEEGPAIRLRPALIDMLRHAIRHLPPATAAGVETAGMLQQVLPVYLAFIRRRALADLMPAVQQRSFGRGGWIHDTVLRPRLLLAAYACSASVEGWRFLGRVTREPTLLRELDYRQLMVFALEFLFSTQDRIHEREDRYRLREALDRLTDSAMRADGRPELLSFQNFPDFSNDVMRAMQEVCDNMMADQDTRAEVRRLADAILSYSDDFFYRWSSYKEFAERFKLRLRGDTQSDGSCDKARTAP